MTVVLLNRSDDNIKTTITLKTDFSVTTFDTFRTSLKEDCAAVGKTPVAGGKAVLTLPPRSIVTMYGKAG